MGILTGGPGLNARIFGGQRRGMGGGMGMGGPPPQNGRGGGRSDVGGFGSGPGGGFGSGPGGGPRGPR